MIPTAQQTEHRTERRLGGTALLLAGTAALVHALPPISAMLAYDRARVAAGEMWRIVTCHVTHYTLDHLVWDGIVFASVGTLCLRDSPRRTWATLATATAALPATLWLLHPQLSTYRGLSGLDTALFALLCTRALVDNWISGDRRRLIASAAAMIVLLGKTSYEIVSGTTLFADGAGEFVAVPTAHIVGAIVGMIVGLVPAKSK